MLTEKHPNMRDSQMPLAQRIDAAINRVTRGDCNMRIPVEATDPDIVLSDCKAALGAKDAEIAAMRAERDAALRLLDSQEATRKGEVALDTARLDKLPQCFHELRFSCALGASPEMWWFTRTPSTIYYTVREAIDAHVAGEQFPQFFAATEY